MHLFYHYGDLLLFQNANHTDEYRPGCTQPVYNVHIVLMMSTVKALKKVCFHFIETFFSNYF